VSESVRAKPPSGDLEVSRQLDPQSVDFSSPFYVVEVRTQAGQWMDITARVESLTHVDSGTRRTSTLEVELDNRDDYVVAQFDLMRKSAIWRARYGYPNLVREAGEFVAKEHEGNAKRIVVRAYERKRSRSARRMQPRTWRDVTRSQVVRDVLRKLGIPAHQVHVTDTTTRYPTITQAAEDDWSFLQGLADLQGFDLWADEGGVYWMRAPRDKRPSHLFRRVRNAIGIGYIQDYDIDSFGAGVPGRVVLKGRDPRRKTTYEVVADGTQTEDLVLLADSESLVTPDDGDRQNTDDGYELRRNIGMRSAKEAKRLAEAIYKEYRYGALKLKLKVFGDPTLRTHRVVMVWGIGPTVDGLYAVKTVRHTFGAGYECEVELQRDGIQKKSKKTSVAPEDIALQNLLGAKSDVRPRGVGGT